MEIISMNDNIDHFNKQDSKMILQENNQKPSSPPSPTHEFSFTISLHHHQQPPIAAIDLSPADDIFFQGHLLPLHFPISSPRSSTNSMDSYTLPMNLLYDNNDTIGNTSFHCHHQTTFSEYEEPENNTNMTTQNHPNNNNKSKSFSTMFNIPKWKKRCDPEREERDDFQNKETQINNKKLKLDHLGQLIKRYMKMVFQKPVRRPNNREFKHHHHHQSYSYSGNSIRSKQEEKRMRRGQFSAPASMRTSPANSGILVANSTGSVMSPSINSMTSESSMQELHAAIQAAIAHCKNSIAMDTNT